MIGMVVMAITMVFCYGYMVYASCEISRQADYLILLVRLVGVKINYFSHMNLNSEIQSDKTHQMTKQLMRALMYQVRSWSLIPYLHLPSANVCTVVLKRFIS